MFNGSNSYWPSEYNALYSELSFFTNSLIIELWAAVMYFMNIIYLNIIVFFILKLVVNMIMIIFLLTSINYITEFNPLIPISHLNKWRTLKWFIFGTTHYHTIINIEEEYFIHTRLHSRSPSDPSNATQSDEYLYTSCSCDISLKYYKTNSKFLHCYEKSKSQHGNNCQLKMMYTWQTVFDSRLSIIKGSWLIITILDLQVNKFLALFIKMFVICTIMIIIKKYLSSYIGTMILC